MTPLSRGSAAVIVALLAGAGHAAAINQVDYASLTGTQLVTFDDVVGDIDPGTNYDGVLVSGGVSFGERFAGQTNAPSGFFDVLAGTPTNPLTLSVGAPDENVNVYRTLTSPNVSSQVLAGLGPLGFDNPDAIGEGAFAALFPTDQSQFGFQLVGGNGGSATLNFFRRNGSLIDTLVVTGLSNAFYGFSREGGINDIAGVSLFNNDLAGIAVDNVRHDAASVPPQPVPEPSSIALLGLGIAALAARRSRG